MDLHTVGTDLRSPDGYLHSRRAAFFAFAMTIGLMVFDYVDRQVIVSIFPHLKAAWKLSDKELGALVSIVSVTVALGGIPIALFADRVSRVKSIAAMAVTWSLATVSCVFTHNYSQLLLARGIVGVGEAGYGSTGAALIASHFPTRMRGSLMAAFFASASVGSVIGVMLGGIIASKWGWEAAFGVVGFPGLLLACLYLFVRDYPTVRLTTELEYATRSAGGVGRRIVHVLARSRTMMWICIAAPAQLIVLSSVWAWLPSFLNRVHGMTPAAAGVQAALVVLIGAVGSLISGAIVDRAGLHSARARFVTMATLCIATFMVLTVAFGAPVLGVSLAAQTQFGLIAFGGFLMTCTAGPVSAVVIDVTHPGVRATGCSILSLVQNLFGLALGPVLSGFLSDAIGLEPALAIVPTFSLLAAAALLLAARTYDAEKKIAAESTEAQGDLAGALQGAA
jgi:MFS transporter, Spinster family, sphingosine-1-phosphate transporter